MRHYAVIGKSLKHSFSPDYFVRKFKNEAILDAFYTAIEVATVDSLRDFVRDSHLNGFNVTIPYKEAIVPLLDSCDPVAKAVQAVNCVKRVKGGYRGFNTDVIGFEQTLRPMLGNRSVNALVLGSGGASRAVQYVLKKMNIPFVVVSRNNNKHLKYSDLTANILKSHQLIINCTPLGTWPNIEEKPALPYHHFGKRTILYDLTYNPPVSAFLREGLSRGAQVRNGLKMLRIQAEESWKIWELDKPD